MTNRPFLSDTNKIYDESCFQTVPAQYGQNNLLLTYGQQRRIFDTSTASIGGQNFQNGQNIEILQRPQYGQLNQNAIFPIRQIFQNGVNYTFPNQEQTVSNNFREMGIDYNGGNFQNLQFNNNQVQNPMFLQNQFANQQLNQLNQPINQLNQQLNQLNQPLNQLNQPLNQLNQQLHHQLNQQSNQQPQIFQFANQISPPPLLLTLEQQIALNELKKHALETMLLHETLKKNPFSLKFHFNEQTDTNDLYYKSNGNSKLDLYPSKEEKVDQQPESLHSEASKRKLLQIQPLKDDSRPNNENNLDKETQNVPEITSVETQCESSEHCNCSCGCCKCEKGMQTKRRVSFENEPEVSKKDKKKKPINRGVNDDSDSSSAYEDISFD